MPIHKKYYYVFKLVTATHYRKIYNLCLSSLVDNYGNQTMTIISSIYNNSINSYIIGILQAKFF